MEMGSTFTSKMPKYPTDDPHYRIIRRVPSRYLHYYFYIRDPVIGPLAMCVGTYLPFPTTYYLNGHNFIEIELSADIIEKRLNYRSTRSLSIPAKWDSSAWQPIRSPTSSGCASPNGCAVSSTACSKSSTTAIM
ncbi:MAG: hypothetical protein IT488_13000 [Gammaproteobacteria bacterium]|nr:hypothetical protein [Gammaproteobacteria bacterium]